MNCTPVRTLLLAAAFALAAAVPASAQYFGQNKVQYKTFDFKVLHTDHFDIYFYPEEREQSEVAARLAERWYSRLSRVLNHKLKGRQPLILYASGTDFQQTNVIPGMLGEGIGGVTESVHRRIVLPLAGTLRDTDHVIGHELVHAFQYDEAEQLSETGPAGRTGIESLPGWFVEGMAEYLSIGRDSPLTAMWMRDAVAQEKLPDISDLDNPKYFPYRWGQALWAYIGGRWGDRAVARTLTTAIAVGDYDRAFKEVLGEDSKALSKDWHQTLRRAFESVAEETRPVSEFAKALTPGHQLGNSLNVSPALSPDGTKVAFLSSRDLFSVDLYVADARTGEIQHKLTSTAVDPHFSSLQFISSSGAWAPDGRRLAVIGVAEGRPVVAIYDVEKEEKVREVRLGDLDGALNPAWSPDGRTIALAGMKGGLTNLYALELQTSNLTRLTSDGFAALQPSWSPDGTKVAFVTDRFSTDLDDLDPGHFRLAVMDVSSRRVTPLRTFDRGDAFDPAWADAGHLFFVADPDGIPNIYRVDTRGGAPRQVTSLFTGVSGITEESPAMAAASGRLAFSVFEKGDYHLYQADDPTVLAGSEPVSPPNVNAAILPPQPPQPTELTQVLQDDQTGLPQPYQQPEVTPYSSSLHLDNVGAPTFAVGADRFGAYGGGGVALSMSDTLGYHHLAVAFQSVSSFDSNFSANDLGGAVLYENTRNRWHWGVEGDQTPYRSGFVTESAGVLSDGTPVAAEQAIIQRQTERGFSGMASYPFSRASRVELGAGYRSLSFDEQLHTIVYNLETGDVLSDQRETNSTFAGLNLGTATAAFVYDTSSFGATSPVLGQRYRLEVTPTFGSIDYTGVLADYRRYFMPWRLYTVAARVMHYGRYGSGGEDSRLFPLFIGYPSLVRGYDVGTFDSSDCVPSATSSCPSFDRLIGSRMLVGNLEFRFPLLRPFGLTENVYGPVPIEVAAFADAGVAWTSGDKPDFFGGDRKGVSSVGAALRVNALGFAVLQFDLAKPLQRPNKGWVFQFSLAPGF